MTEKQKEKVVATCKSAFNSLVGIAEGNIKAGEVSVEEQLMITALLNGSFLNYDDVFEDEDSCDDDISTEMDNVFTGLIKSQKSKTVETDFTHSCNTMEERIVTNDDKTLIITWVDWEYADSSDSVFDQCPFKVELGKPPKPKVSKAEKALKSLVSITEVLEESGMDVTLLKQFLENV